MAENLVSLRLTDEEMDLLEWLTLKTGDPSRGECLRSLILLRAHLIDPDLPLLRQAMRTSKERRRRRSPDKKRYDIACDKGGQTRADCDDKPEPLPDIVIEPLEKRAGDCKKVAAKRRRERGPE